MADRRKKFPDNMPGIYYVDFKCIACDACVGIAQDYFKMNDNEGHAFVYNQPVEEFNFELCEEAMEACPVSAIGNDGISRSLRSLK